MGEQLDLFNPRPQPVDRAPKIVLRDYQVAAVEATFDNWRDGHRSTLVCLPTGCGKSVVFSEVMARWCRENS